MNGSKSKFRIKCTDKSVKNNTVYVRYFFIGGYLIVNIEVYFDGATQI
jgi:hypothetical protein